MSLLPGLQAQAGRIEQLLTLLDEERAMLGSGHIDTTELDRLTRHKQALLDTTAAFEQTHLVTLEKMDRQDLSFGDVSSDCLRVRRSIRAQAREAARKNHFNGQLIHIRMTSNQRLLNDLQTLAGKDLYGPDGQASAGGRRLGTS